MVSGFMSRWRLVTSCVCQGSVLDPLLFNIFNKDTNDGIECTLSKFADDTKLSSTVDTAKGRDAVQRDLNKLKRWTLVNLMKFNKANCRVLCFCQGNPTCVYKLGEGLLESSPAEKDLGVLIHEKLHTSQRYVLAA